MSKPPDSVPFHYYMKGFASLALFALFMTTAGRDSAYIDNTLRYALVLKCGLLSLVVAGLWGGCAPALAGAVVCLGSIVGMASCTACASVPETFRWVVIVILVHTAQCAFRRHISLLHLCAHMVFSLALIAVSAWLEPASLPYCWICWIASSVIFLGVYGVTRGLRGEPAQSDV